jgi:hypothetical protein
MEVLIPAVALGGLYLINNQSKSNETFQNRQTSTLPNTNLPNRNYPEEYPIVSSDTDQTSELTNNNRYDTGGAGVYTDKYFNPAALQPQTNSSQEYYALTGNKVDAGYFEHNNMVPYFGSNTRTRVMNENAAEGILDNYSGAGSQYIKKQEQSPMFKPTDNEQWAYGAPNMSDFYQSRMNPSMRMANVKPFEEEIVGPGLGQGYGSAGVGGFNTGMMARETWLPKTADQLRVDNKPKATGVGIYGYEGPANSAIKQNATIEQMGVMEKHLPEQSFEMGQDRLFTTTGVEKGQTLHALPIDRYVSRPETAVEYTGIAGSHLPETYVQGEYMPTHNQQLAGLPLAGANANGRNYATDSDYEIRAKTAYPNNRTANKQDNYFGLVSGSLGAVVAPLLDALRPSRRQNVIGTLRPYQNPGTRVSESYIFNPADRLPTTIRETTESSKFHHNVNANQLGGAYQTTDHYAPNTYRQETSDFYYAGGASATANSRQTRSYEAAYNQRNNDVRQDLLNGYTPAGGMSLLNGDINMRQVSRDNQLMNNRAAIGDMPYQSPNVNGLGRVAGNSNELYSGIHMERNTPDIMDSLKGNPFIVNYKNGL